MIRFESKENVTRVDLGEGDWAEIPAVITSAQAREFGKAASNEEALMLTVRAWSLKGPDGQPVPVTREWVDRLDVRAATAIIRAVADLVTLPKATSPESDAR